MSGHESPGTERDTGYYLVVRETDEPGADDSYGPVEAETPDDAIRRVEDSYPVKFTQHTEFLVYPLNQGAGRYPRDGGVLADA